MTTDQIAALTTKQVQQGLTTDQVVALTTDQVKLGLTTNQISNGLTTAQVKAMETGDVAVLTTAQIRALSTAQVQNITTAQIGALSTDQVAALSTTQVQQGLTTAQVVALSTDQVSHGLTTAQVQALTTAQVKAIETGDIAVMTTDQIAALTTKQVQQGLTTDQVVALTTDQVKLGLTTNQIVSLTTTQIHALTTQQVEALTTAQTSGVLTSDQIPALNTSGTPLVLDLNGNGITTQNIDKGVKFDIFGVGQNVNTGWVAGGDGLLVMDRNRDGVINGGTELFGQGTNLASGAKATNGYQALAELDTNGDGLVSSTDASFNDLMVWVDSNSDGQSQTGELHSLSSLGITSLDLSAQASSAVDNGNLVGLVSSYTTTDGASHQMADVWFATHEIPADIAVPEPKASTAPPISLAMPESALTAPVVTTATAVGAPTQDLNAQVGGLVDAMQAFGSSGSTKAADSGSPNLNVPTASAKPLASGLLGMVDALKQFDANGQPALAVPAATSVAGTINLKTGLPPKPDGETLALGK
jgi:hypothetical protein